MPKNTEMSKAPEYPIAEDLVSCPACDGQGWDVAPDQPCSLKCTRLYEATLIADGDQSFRIADYEGPTVVTKTDAQAWFEKAYKAG
jgi:hypothetical protein